MYWGALTTRQPIDYCLTTDVTRSKPHVHICSPYKIALSNYGIPTFSRKPMCTHFGLRVLVDV